MPLTQSRNEDVKSTAENHMGKFDHDHCIQGTEKTHPFRTDQNVDYHQKHEQIFLGTHTLSGTLLGVATASGKLRRPISLQR